MTKFLWIVEMNAGADQARLLADANAAGASAVCVRTDNTALPAAIATFHAAGLQVLGWRWPAVVPGPHTALHYFALDEADYVTNVLMPAGLDGYIVDIESDGPGQVNDWDDAAHQPLASQFCKKIEDAIAAGIPTSAGDFSFGLTSGCRQPTNNPNIPWATFVAASDALYPQAYWRAALAGGPTAINGHTPAAAIALAKAAWTPIAAGTPFRFMGGELALATAGEIAEYGAATTGQDQLHIYADENAIAADVLAAIKAL